MNHRSKYERWNSKALKTKHGSGAYFYKLGFKKQRFLKQDQKKKKTLITKEKKLVSCSTLKDSFNLSSKTPKEKLISTQWEKTCATHLFSKGLICKVYKEFTQIIEKNRQQTEKWAKHLKRPSQKKGMSRWPIHLWKDAQPHQLWAKHKSKP